MWVFTHSSGVEYDVFEVLGHSFKLNIAAGIWFCVAYLGQGLAATMQTCAIGSVKHTLVRADGEVGYNGDEFQCRVKARRNGRCVLKIRETAFDAEA